MIFLLKEIKEELIIERKSKLRNALILATAIVLFAVPLNFMVEIGANFIDEKYTDDEYFYGYGQALYAILAIFSVVVILGAFFSFYRPFFSIFVNQFDWETAFRDVEEAGQTDKYYMNPDGEMLWYCDVCGEEFSSERQAELHEEECEGKE